METEVTNTLLGILTLPAWLEAILAITSVSFLLWMSWIKSKRQTEALEALEDACKALCAVSRETIIAQRNRAELDNAVLNQSGLLSDAMADRLVRLAIDACFSRFVIFARMHKDSHQIEPLAKAFRDDAFLDFCKTLSGVKLKDGLSLSDFARICQDEFDFWEHGVIYNQDLFAPCDRFKSHMDKKWRSFSGFN
jgi:hypothetical protein